MLQHTRWCVGLAATVALIAPVMFAAPIDENTDDDGANRGRPARVSDAVTTASAEGRPLGTPIALLPRAVTSFGATEHGGYAYVLGGYEGIPHQYSKLGQSDDFYRINLSDPRDVTLLPNDFKAQSVILVAHADHLVRMGGMQALNEPGTPAVTKSVTDVAVFHPDTRTWTDATPLPRPRSSHEAVVVGDQVWIVGGWKLAEGDEDAVWYDTVISGDLSQGPIEWVEHAAPFRRRALGLAGTSRHVVAIGGMLEHGAPTAQVDVLDTVTGAWTLGPDFPGSAFACAAVGVGDDVYASGMDGTVYAWRVGEPAWTAVAHWSFPRFFHQLVATGSGQLLALGGIGGMDGSGRIRHIESLDPEAPAAPRVSTWTIPAPGAARNRQGLVLAGRDLFLFGGNNATGQHDFEAENFITEGWKLDLTDFTWAPVADIPQRRQSMRMVRGDGALGYAVGGFGHDGQDAVTWPDVWSYDPMLDIWMEERAVLPGRGRTQFGLAHHGDALWVFGGMDFDPRRGDADAFRHETAVLRWDLGDRQGTFMETGLELPGPRRAFGGSELDGRYYLVGGMREEFGNVEDAFAFDFATGAFEEIATPRRVRISPHLIPVQGRLVLLGGTSTDEAGVSGTDRSVEVYDPATDHWTMVIEELPFDMRLVQAIPFGNQVLVFSTMEQENQARVSIIDVSGG